MSNEKGGWYNYAGPPYSRTKIYAARKSHGSSSHRSISAARARPQQQTRRAPLLLSIDGTDRRTATQPFYDAYHTHYADGAKFNMGTASRSPVLTRAGTCVPPTVT